MTLVVSTTLKRQTPLSTRTGVLLYTKAVDFILGKKYDLSLVFVGNARSKMLNRMYRDKDKTTNVLAFPLSKTSGEIIIALPYAQKEASDFETSVAEHLLYLFVHGCYHLKGMDHGPAMERAEKRALSALKKRT